MSSEERRQQKLEKQQQEALMLQAMGVGHVPVIYSEDETIWLEPPTRGPEASLTHCHYCSSMSVDSDFRPGTCGNCGGPREIAAEKEPIADDVESEWEEGITYIAARDGWAATRMSYASSVPIEYEYEDMVKETLERLINWRM